MPSLVPILSDYSQNGYTVTCGHDDSGYEAWRVFAQDPGHGWYDGSQGLPDFVTVQLPSAAVANGFSITSITDGNWSVSPADFNLYGSNDGATWAALVNAATGTTDFTAATWTGGDQTQSWDLANTTAYLYYKFTVNESQSYGATAVVCGPIQWSGQSGGGAGGNPLDPGVLEG